MSISADVVDALSVKHAMFGDDGPDVPQLTLLGRTCDANYHHARPGLYIHSVLAP